MSLNKKKFFSRKTIPSGPTFVPFLVPGCPKKSRNSGRAGNRKPNSGSWSWPPIVGDVIATNDHDLFSFKCHSLVQFASNEASSDVNRALKSYGSTAALKHCSIGIIWQRLGLSRCLLLRRALVWIQSSAKFRLSGYKKISPSKICKYCSNEVTSNVGKALDGHPRWKMFH